MRLRQVTESIRFAHLEGDKTKLVYDGRFSVGWGPLGWLIGRFRVKPQFDRVVQEHLHQAKEVAEKRAEKTKVHAGSARMQRGRSR